MNSSGSLSARSVTAVSSRESRRRAPAFVEEVLGGAPAAVEAFRSDVVPRPRRGSASSGAAARRTLRSGPARSYMRRALRATSWSWRTASGSSSCSVNHAAGRSARRRRPGHRLVHGADQQVHLVGEHLVHGGHGNSGLEPRRRRCVSRRSPARRVRRAAASRTRRRVWAACSVRIDEEALTDVHLGIVHSTQYSRTILRRSV